MSTIVIAKSILSSNLALKLETRFHSFPSIERLNIAEPGTVERFPHFPTLKGLTLTNLPPTCDDWTWMKTLESLQDFDVSVKGRTGGTARLHVHGKKAEWIAITDEEALPTLMNGFEHLPQNIKTKVQCNIE